MFIETLCFFFVKTAFKGIISVVLLLLCPNSCLMYRKSVPFYKKRDAYLYLHVWLQELDRIEF